METQKVEGRADSSEIDISIYSGWQNFCVHLKSGEVPNLVYKMTYLIQMEWKLEAS